MMSTLLASLIQVSEKAANIARVCRQDEHLFTLLVEEKKSEEKNPRFVHDFKTLADVLIQETVKHDICEEFPELAPHIKGEESNTFNNTLGDSISVEVFDDEASTAALLSQVLNGDSTAAKLLAAEVHRCVALDDVTVCAEELPQDLVLPLDHLGIWIDPIDSTAEYIIGDVVEASMRDIHPSGLRCVTVLIGVFDRRSGEPVVGVVNQPFYTFQDSRWQGRCVWGVSCQGFMQWSQSQLYKTNPGDQKVVVLSTSESPLLKTRLTTAGFTSVEAAGAGYKILCVATGSADAYLLSKGTTYRWDTCAPHALLKAQGGGVIPYLAAEEPRQNLQLAVRNSSMSPVLSCLLL